MKGSGRQTISGSQRCSGCGFGVCSAVQCAGMVSFPEAHLAYPRFHARLPAEPLFHRTAPSPTPSPACLVLLFPSLKNALFSLPHSPLSFPVEFRPESFRFGTVFAQVFVRRGCYLLSVQDWEGVKWRAVERSEVKWSGVGLVRIINGKVIMERQLVWS